jgi:hypothetical protein
MKYLVCVTALALGAAFVTSRAEAQCYGGYGGYHSGIVVAAPVVYSSYRPVYSGYGHAYRPYYGHQHVYRPYYGGYYSGYGRGYGRYGYYGRGYGRGGVYIGFGW